MVSGTDASDMTGPPSDRRRLIVVVHADVVGYSRLIGLRIPERPRASDVGTPASVKAKRGRSSTSLALAAVVSTLYQGTHDQIG
jgi:hypothetical protein